MHALRFSFGRSENVRRFVVGFCIAAVFTLLLNAASLRSFAHGRLTMTQLGLDNISADEAHYFAMIKDAAEGSVNLGNTSLKEHRSDPNVSTFAPLLQGSLMRFFGLRLESVILLGDILFPFFGAFILFMILSAFRFTMIDAALVTLFSLSSVAWQRSVNPQISVPLLLLCIGLFLLSFRASKRQLLLQGLLTALLVFVHVLYAEFLIASELVLLTLRLLFLQKNRRLVFQRSLLTVLPTLIACGIKILITGSMSSEVSVDTYRRLGMIPSHLPAAPMMQLTILLTLALFLLFRKRKLCGASPIFDGLSLLLIGGLFCLNQSIVSGFDLVFGLYFAVPIVILLRMMWLGLLLSFAPIPLLVRRVLAALLVIASLLPVFSALNDRSVRDDSYDVVIAALASEPTKEEVILAPIEVSNLIPVLTSHFVVFNQYAHFEPALDSEMTDRFLLEKSLFPIVREEGDPLFSWVFGLYAGNLAARTRTACRIEAFFTHEDCKKDPRSFVFHQDLLKRLEAGTVDRKAMLKKFQVDLIVSENKLPPDIRSLCPLEKSIGSYRIYRCTLSL